MTDSSKDFSDEILELKLQLENERQLRLQAETELQAKSSGFSNGNIGSAEVRNILCLHWRIPRRISKIVLQSILSADSEILKV